MSDKPVHRPEWGIRWLLPARNCRCGARLVKGKCPAYEAAVERGTWPSMPQVRQQ